MNKNRRLELFAFLFFISFLFSFFLLLVWVRTSLTAGEEFLSNVFIIWLFQILTHYFSKGWAFNLTTFCILNVNIHKNVRQQSSFFFESLHTQIDIYHAESKYSGGKKDIYLYMLFHFRCIQGYKCSCKNPQCCYNKP